MKHLLIASLTAIAIVSPASAADNKGTADEAQVMVKRAVDAFTADGAEKTHAAITAKDPRFVDRDLYVIAYDLNGACLAHGFNPKMVGKDFVDVQDVDGKYYVKERVELARSKGKFWQDYKFTNPTTKKIEAKSTYCEAVASEIICVGIYK